MVDHFGCDCICFDVGQLGRVIQRHFTDSASGGIYNLRLTHHCDDLLILCLSLQVVRRHLHQGNWSKWQCSSKSTRLRRAYGYQKLQLYLDDYHRSNRVSLLRILHFYTMSTITNIKGLSRKVQILQRIMFLAWLNHTLLLCLPRDSCILGFTV